MIRGIDIDPILPFLEAEKLLGSFLTFKIHLTCKSDQML